MSGKMMSRRRLLGISSSFAASCCLPGLGRAADRKKHPDKLTIMLDPGHGGVDPGCIGMSGTFEKDITSATVTEAARLLGNSGRYRVLLTRQSDIFVPLDERVAKARQAKADLFLSVHADSLPKMDMRGASIFTLSETASDELAGLIAIQENSVDILGGLKFHGQTPAVDAILLDLLQRETRNLSLKLSHALLSELSREIVMLPHSERAANFAVLRAPDVPAALVEIGCLSNKDEERELGKVSYRRLVAEALVQSIDQYFSRLS